MYNLVAVVGKKGLSSFSLKLKADGMSFRPGTLIILLERYIPTLGSPLQRDSAGPSLHSGQVENSGAESEQRSANNNITCRLWFIKY